MKHLKILGLAVIAAAAITAFRSRLGFGERPLHSDSDAMWRRQHLQRRAQSQHDLSGFH
jgi:hypothetical protein